jgi:hypothetical protein
MDNTYKTIVEELPVISFKATKANRRFELTYISPQAESELNIDETTLKAAIMSHINDVICKENSSIENCNKHKLKLQTFKLYTKNSELIKIFLSSKLLRSENNELTIIGCIQSEYFISESSELPITTICMCCKKIRTDNGDWVQLEQYFSEHLDIEFSHGLCNHCEEEYRKLLH